MVKQKINKVIAVMLVLAVMLTSIIAGAMLLAPKTGEVNAAGTSATLLNEYNETNYRYIHWYTKLSDPIYYFKQHATDKFEGYLINQLLITTDASKINGYTQGVGSDSNAINLASDSSQNPIYYYYKQTNTKIDITGGSVTIPDNEYDEFNRYLFDLVIYANVDTIYAPVNSISLFSGLQHCQSITFENFNTSNVTNMSSMFSSCSSLTSLNLSSFNTSNVTEMAFMFTNCESLTSLDLSSFNTSNVTYISGMFSGCTSLTSLDVSENFASNVTDMSGMFQYCSSLTSLDLSNFNTGNVTNMSRMFADCTSLTSLDLSSFDTSNVTTVEKMFSNCTSLKTLNLKGWDTSLMIDIAFAKYGGGYTGSMFSDCTSLETLDISTFTFVVSSDMPISAVKTYLLKDCTSLKQLHVPANMNGFEIDLPAALYVNGAGDPITTITSAHQGTILTLQGVEPILPPDVGEIDPDTPESGVTLVDLLILTMLALTLSGVCVIILKNKNKSLNKR